ncbi:MAG: nucleotidyltransferase [Geothermobacteraceae bacterium]
MRTVGLITEYNPFHNGHLHHLQESRRVADAEVAVAVMSGHFLQRGEPALVDKWRRTRMALAAGVDVVVELPFPWACNSAPLFAEGAVRCLESLGSIDALCFGSEAGSLADLQVAAKLLEDQSGAIDKGTRELLRQGRNYPAARAQVVAGLAGESEARLLAGPNNILGIEYLRALVRLNSGMTPLTIPRVGAGYHDEQAVGQIASATGIRAMLRRGEAVGDYLPPASAALLAEARLEGQISDPDVFLRLLAAVIARDPAALDAIYQVEHGLADRLLAVVRASDDLDGLIGAVKARHLTRTRVQRLLCYVLLGARRDEMEEALQAGPRFLHLLGCSERGRHWLARTRKDRSLPLVQNYSRVRATLKRAYGTSSAACAQALRQLDLEERATQLYGLLLQRRPPGSLQRDYSQSVVGPEISR